MELGCFISPLCWWVVFFFVVKVARAVSVCFFCSVVTPLRKDQLSEMSPGLYRSANMWHIQAGFPAAWTPSECELQGCLVMYFIFGLIWNLKGYTKSGNRLWSLQGTQYVPFFFFFPPKSFFSCLHLLPLSNLCTGKSNKATECSESLPLNRNSEGGSGQHLPISHTQKDSSTEITKAMVFLFWVGLFPSKKGSRKYQEITFLENY